LPELHTADEDVQFFTNSVFGTGAVFVALDEHRRIIGFIAFSEGWVKHLYLPPDFQRLGIGGRLLEKARKEWPRLRLWTFEPNSAALGFYELRGFSVIRRTDGQDKEGRARRSA
jgi:GNAT superfamily N-acetyltransferase